MIKLLKVAVNGSLQFGVVVNVHLCKFSVLTVLGVELDELVKLKDWCWVLVDTDRGVFVLSQVQLDNPDKVIVVENRVFQILRIHKSELEPGQYTSHRIPLDIALVFFSIIRQQYPVIVDFNKYRPHLEMQHLVHGVLVSDIGPVHCAEQ